MGEKFDASRGRGEINMNLPKQTPKRRADKRGVGNDFDWGPGGEEVGKAAVANDEKGRMVQEVMDRLDELSDEELNELYEALVEDADPEDFEDFEFDEDDLDDEFLEEIEVEDPLEDLETEMYEAFKVSSDQIDLSEFAKTVDGMQDLSEDLKVSTKNIFETVVVNTINDRLATICESLAEYAREALADREAYIVSRLDEYLDDVIQEWLENNVVAIEKGIRADLAESFMANLKELFVEHYIDLPEEQVDVASALAVKNEELMDVLNRKQETIEEQAKMIDMYRKRDTIIDVCEDLSEAQLAKVYDLVENVAWESEEQFKRVVEDVRNSAFPRDGSRSTILTEDAVGDSGTRSTGNDLPEEVQSVFAVFGNAKKDHNSQK